MIKYIETSRQFIYKQCHTIENYVKVRACMTQARKDDGKVTRW